MELSKTVVLIVFASIISVLLFFDLRSLVKAKSHVKSNANAVLWTLVWVGSAMLFGFFVWQQEGFEKFTQFQSAYWIEQSLSVDNLFVFLLVFRYFKVDGKGQSKVLLWGILGAIVLRAIFIFAGSWLIDLTFLPTFSIGSWTFGGDENNPAAAPHFGNINMLITVFGSMLVYGGFKTLLIKESEDAKDFGNSIGAKIARKLFRVRMDFYGNRFFILEKRKYFATLLFVVLCVIETTDLIFAVDSIPAIFSIAPNDPFILYTSNIFAIFGLRSLYFLIANSMDRFSKLQFGISFILIFIGVKMVLAPIYHIETYVSLIVIVSLLLFSIGYSLLSKDKA